ncbi:HpcH/HpaI aldolase family protein [Neptunicoccus cionae]|uniref:HpcH/HpaI aldolase family protein n=1 Tax=Neptunicoccus cionae TaxID=2035344 RepID=UPI000C788AE4|nr:aldolase/citrate lyase family protein [Amylibacter cionae]PLS21496.1 hypothetical protein C0U40_11920 [Amylibacter cionae]
MSYRATFAKRLRARDRLVGSFIKSSDPANVEILGLAGFDFAILDAEHAAIDRTTIAAMAMAARAAKLPLLVRIPETGHHWVATALDAGAAGIMAPQVRDAEMARALVAATRFGAQGRGFSPSTAGADYGARGISAHLKQVAQETVLICQIEDEPSVAQAGDIAAVNGVDGLLLGPVDLTVSLGLTDPAAAEVETLCQDTITAAEATGTAAGLFLGNPADSGKWQKAGANLFVIGSDQAFLMGAARTALKQFGHNS